MADGDLQLLEGLRVGQGHWGQRGESQAWEALTWPQSPQTLRSFSKGKWINSVQARPGTVETQVDLWTY